MPWFSHMQEILLFKNSSFVLAHILSPLWKLEKFTHKWPSNRSAISCTEETRWLTRSCYSWSRRVLVSIRVRGHQSEILQISDLQRFVSLQISLPVVCCKINEMRSMKMGCYENKDPQKLWPKNPDTILVLMLCNLRPHLSFCTTKAMTPRLCKVSKLWGTQHFHV